MIFYLIFYKFDPLYFVIFFFLGGEGQNRPMFTFLYVKPTLLGGIPIYLTYVKSPLPSAFKGAPK